MMGYGSGGGSMGGIFLIILLVLGVVAVVWVMRARSSGDGYRPPVALPSSGLSVLEERYAKGEIQRDEYLQKKRDLGD